MTAIISKRATTTSPIVPAKESNILSQYSPAPVVNNNPIEKQNKQTTPVYVCGGKGGDSWNEWTNDWFDIINALSFCGYIDKIDLILNIPVTYGLLILLKISMSKMVQSIPSSMPIWEPRPNDKSMVKKRMDQIGAAGNSTIAWVKTMNASPVPSAAYI